MPVIPQDRPLDALRSEAIDRLIMNYGHGRLSLEAFERRLDQALDAESHQTLEALTADLDLDIDERFIAEKRAELGLAGADRIDRRIEHVVNVFSSGGRSGPWTVPDEIRVFTIFGSTNLDLSDARFSMPETRVKVLCLFGAVDIFVREGIATSTKTICLFGAIDNNVPGADEPDAPHLVVDGLVLFGAVDAKIKRTMKERLFEFANSLRQMFSDQPPVRRRPPHNLRPVDVAERDADQRRDSIEPKESNSAPRSAESASAARGT